MKLNLSQQMKDIFDSYTDEIVEEVKEIIEDVGREAADELHHAGSFEGHKYRSGWSTTIESKRTFDSVIVHNKKKYNLTHLLEFGHAKVGGGRTREFPHIAPVNDKAIKRAEERIIKAIQGTG